MHAVGHEHGRAAAVPGKHLADGHALINGHERNLLISIRGHPPPGGAAIPGLHTHSLHFTAKRPKNQDRSAVGQCRWLGFTHPSPTSRGLGCFVSFLFRRQSAYTADGPRAGAVRLRRSGDGRRGKTDDGSPKPPQAASPCSWTCRRLLPPPPQPTRTAAHPPPARGAGVRLHGAEGYWLSAPPTGPPPRQIWPGRGRSPDRG